MKYDVQRWDSPDYDVELEPLDDGLWVLAADAEAHEKAAVEAVERDAIAVIKAEARAVQQLERELADARNQAIRDCIKVVEALPAIAQMLNAEEFVRLVFDKGEALDALRALLTEGSEK